MRGDLELVDPSSTFRSKLRAILVMCAALCCCATVRNSAPTIMPAGWLDILRASGAGSESPSGSSYSWIGADNRGMSVSVALPNINGHAVELIRPVLGDNGPQIQEALAKLRASGGGTLRLFPGNYVVAGGPPALNLLGLKDVAIEGQGATITFSEWGDGLHIQSCVRLAIKGISFRYAAPAVLPAVIRHSALGNEIVADPSQIRALSQAKIYQITEYDKAKGSFVPNARRLLLGRDGESLIKTGSNRFVLSSGRLKDFEDARPIELKLSYYNGAAIRIADPGDTPVSHDITFDGVTVQNSPGMGISVDLMHSGLAVLNSQIGLRMPSSNTVTIAYDAFHVTAMAGGILVNRNKFTASGDDAINIGSPIFDLIQRPALKEAKLRAKTGGVYVGAVLAFFDADLRWLGNSKVVRRSPRTSGAQIDVDFSDNVPDGSRYARNIELLSSRYAVVDNEVYRCQCHGILAQNPNGIIKGNVFTSLRANAIRLVVSAWWREGSGAQNIVVQKNIIEDTGDDSRRGVVWGAITLYAELGDDGGQDQPAVATEAINDSILIDGNSISDVDQGCISVASSSRVKITNNGCKNFNRRLDRSQLLVERTNPIAGARRLASKIDYLDRGTGVWIDPLSTANVDLSF